MIGLLHSLFSYTFIGDFMAFLLTTIAGLSTLLGTVFIFFNFKNTDKLINIALGFASGVMIMVSLTDLIPESYQLLSNSQIPIVILLISINVGIIISIAIDKLIPSMDNLYRVGLISMLAIILHNIPEGMATFMATTHDQKLGVCLTLAIALHNIPEGISISLPIYYGTHSKKKAFLYTLLSGMAEVVGGLLTSWFLKDYINDFVMALLLGLIAGIMIHIASYELIPASLKYKNFKRTFISILIGSFVMFISHLLIK